jgi:hypothetical protein
LTGLDSLDITRLQFENFQNPQNKPTVNNRSDGRLPPVHDALLIEGALEEVDEVVAATQQWMAEASRIVLSGFTLRSDAYIVSYPDRYMDERGERLWKVVTEILEDIVDPAPF